MESGYQPQTTYPEVKFNTTAVSPPSNLYMTREDVLTLTVFSSVLVIITIRGRLLRGDGRVIPFSQDFTTSPANRSLIATTMALGEGFLLDLFVFLSSGTSKRGQTFAVASIGRGDGFARIDHTIVAQGYIFGQGNLFWPGGVYEAPNSGNGVLRSIVGTVPGAGAEISETVPTGARWRLKTLNAILTPSAAAATRRPQLVIDDAVNNLSISPHVDTALATVATSYNWTEGAWTVATIVGSGDTCGIASDLRLPAGFRIRTATINIQVADQWTAPHYLVEEWIEP